MTSSASAQDVSRTGRHSAPEVPGALRIATPADVVRRGRHAEPGWDGRLPIHDALRDELAAVDWFSLGSGRA